MWSLYLCNQKLIRQQLFLRVSSLSRIVAVLPQFPKLKSSSNKRGLFSYILNVAAASPSL